MLGLEKGASDDEIKKAFRQSAKKYHPDLHPGDKDCEDKFKEVNEAYEVLSDKEKKRTSKEILKSESLQNSITKDALKREKKTVRFFLNFASHKLFGACNLFLRIKK